MKLLKFITNLFKKQKTVYPAGNKYRRYLKKALSNTKNNQQSRTNRTNHAAT
jgi:hypothetical protein